MDARDEIKIVSGLCRRVLTSVMLSIILGFGWCLLHMFLSIMHMGSHLVHVVTCYIISSGLMKKYRKLRLDKLHYLAVVVDSDEARNITNIKKLLRWLSNIGVKYIMLYDIEGVLKKSLETDWSCLTNLGNKSCSDVDLKHVLSDGKMTIELLSSSDGKEAAAKAASLLCSNYLKGITGSCNKIERRFTEADMATALKAVGCGGPEPDLLLIYGPARCHLGFPAWRMRYTEIVHMGSLKLMKYGAIVKVMYDFSKKHQNYGT